MVQIGKLQQTATHITYLWNWFTSTRRRIRHPSLHVKMQGYTSNCSPRWLQPCTATRWLVLSQNFIKVFLHSLHCTVFCERRQRSRHERRSGGRAGNSAIQTVGTYLIDRRMQRCWPLLLPLPLLLLIHPWRQFCVLANIDYAQHNRCFCIDVVHQHALISMYAVLWERFRSMTMALQQ